MLNPSYIHGGLESNLMLLLPHSLGVKINETCAEFQIKCENRVGFNGSVTHWDSFGIPGF